MKLTLILLLTLCFTLIGCRGKSPSAEQIQAVLESEVKKGNPNASVKLTDIKVETEYYTSFKFDCIDCQLTDLKKNKKVFPLTKGFGAVSFDNEERRWKLSPAFVSSEPIDGFLLGISFEVEKHNF